MDQDQEMRPAEDVAPSRSVDGHRDRERDSHRGRDEDDRPRRRDDSRDRGGRSERDRERDSHRERDRDHRDRDRDGRRDRERDDRRSSHRSHRRSYSRSRSPSPYRSSRHRYRSASRSRSPERERSHRDRHRRRSPSPGYRGGESGYRGRGGGMRGRGGFRGMPKAPTGPMNAPAEEAEAHSKVSQKENRLYVGNLAYDVNYKDLADFMSGVGPVAFSEVLVTPAGMSKGCGIVEYVNTEDAKRAKAELADTQFNGRAVFIREDREQNARFGAPPIPGKMGMALGERGGFPNPGFGGAAAPGGMPNKSLFIGNIPPMASWQNLKDLFREAGEVIRADVGMTPDGRPKGNGTVVFVTPESAAAAIEMYNGFDWNGSVLEVRFDRFQGIPRGRGGMRGAPFMGGRGGFAPGMRGGFAPGFRGGFGGPMGGMMGGGRQFTNDIYADYPGAEAEGGAKDEEMTGGAIDPMGSGLMPEPAEPSAQILVRNLPWSTSNEDLVELFETTGTVLFAEILFEGARSKGQGVVQFSEMQEAETAGSKFTGYVYGGRPLDVQFNPTWHEFTESAAKGGQTVPVEAEVEA